MALALDRVIKLRDRETEQFLDLYRRERVLYDVNIRDYKNRELRTAAAERISNALDIPGFGPREIIYKFKNLRSSYCQELKKIAESERNGTVYRPKVFWFDQMNSFIRPFVQHKNAQPYNVFQTNPSEESNESNSRSPSQHQVAFEDPNDSVKTETPRITLKRERPSPVLQEPPSKSRKSSQQDPLVLSMDDLNGTHQDIPSRVEFVQHGEDVYDTFGKYVASMLRSIGPPTAMRLQAKITSTIVNTMCLLESTRGNAAKRPPSGTESD